MFKFSTKTVVDKQFKLGDIFKQIKADKDVKRDATCIDKITLTNVISSRTLNCEADKTIKEIYVFEIVVSDRTVPEAFIKKLDDAIKVHTLFKLRDDEYEMSMISYKTGSFKGKYYRTNWNKREDIEVPLVNNVHELYKFILSKFLKYTPFEKETAEEYLRRHNMLIKLDFQISRTQSAIRYETQSKKKFEYNSRLKEYEEERSRLLSKSVE